MGKSFAIPCFKELGEGHGQASSPSSSQVRHWHFFEFLNLSQVQGNEATGGKHFIWYNKQLPFTTMFENKKFKHPSLE